MTVRKQGIYDVVVGSDHAGFQLKERIKEFLTERGEQVYDAGTHTTDSVGTAPIAESAGRMVVTGKARRGVLICGTGLGMSIAANKVAGIRAALCHNQFTAALARQHNDANVLVLGSRVLAAELALACLDVWLRESFLQGKYATRLHYLNEIERHSCEQLRNGS